MLLNRIPFLMYANNHRLKSAILLILFLLVLQYPLSFVLYHNNEINHIYIKISNPNATIYFNDSHIINSSYLQENLSICSDPPKGLVGDKFEVIHHSPSWQKLNHDFSRVRNGEWQPENCISRTHVAVIIPYRNRDEHLRTFLANMHPFLQRQEAHYIILIVEQVLGSRFNRASLFNIGFVEALKMGKFDCFIFHDVDLLPEDDRNLYRCGPNPRHMSAAIDKFNYRLPYAGIFGGVSSLSESQFKRINGFSNLFFGWGGEDDDVANRVVWAGYQISRYPMSIARYKMIKHGGEKGNSVNPLRFRLINEGRGRWSKDGLQNLEYSVRGILTDKPTVRWIQVDIDEKHVLQKWNLA